MVQRGRKGLPLLLGLAPLLNIHSQTLDQLLEEQTVLAALALNIMRFSTWPAEAQLKESIDFCVVGLVGAFAQKHTD